MTKSNEKELVLVLGGSRSGKSTWALRYIEEHYSSYLFLATAEALDKEMEERVRLHKESRDSKWELIEEPLEISGSLDADCGHVDAVLIDCMTVWLSNVLLKQGDNQVKPYQERLFKSLSGRKQSIVIVSNEVGAGIVPEHALGRKYRDLSGILNQKIAALADKVIFIIAGLPVCIKGDINQGGLKIQNKG